MKRLFPAFLLLLGSCGGSSSGDGFRDVALTDLACSSLDGASGIWESASFPGSSDCGAGDAGAAACCAWVELPAHTELRIEHALGAPPRLVEPWISFTPYGVGATPAAGDALRVLSADDAFIVLDNHTAQRFYLRVALR